jgi:2'-5' RNA ligase
MSKKKTKNEKELSNLTSNTALSICPPQYLWPQIQTIRKKYDKASKRWPPHINLMFPFVYPNRFDEIKKKLEKEIQSKSFTLQMEEPSNEVACRSKSVWSLPKSNVDLVSLHKEICKILSMESEFNPHMTFGQLSVNNVEEELKEIQSLWSDLEFDVDEIYLLKKDEKNDSFVIQTSIQLK